MSIDELQGRLSSHHARTTSAVNQDKTKRALADIRRAKTLLEKADLTLAWADRFEQENPRFYPTKI